MQEKAQKVHLFIWEKKIMFFLVSKFKVTYYMNMKTYWQDHNYSYLFNTLL